MTFVLYWPFTILIVIFKHIKVWGGSDNWCLDTLMQFIHITPYGWIVNCLLFSTIIGFIFFILSNSNSLFKSI
jgi:hypothetical protein